MTTTQAHPALTVAELIVRDVAELSGHNPEDPAVMMVTEDELQAIAEYRLASLYAQVEELTKDRNLLIDRNQKLAAQAVQVEALEPFAKLADEIEELCAAYYRTKGAAADPEASPAGWIKSCAWDDLVRAREVLNASPASKSMTQEELDAELDNHPILPPRLRRRPL